MKKQVWEFFKTKGEMHPNKDCWFLKKNKGKRPKKKKKREPCW